MHMWDFSSSSGRLLAVIFHNIPQTILDFRVKASEIINTTVITFLFFIIILFLSFLKINIVEMASCSVNLIISS